MAAKVRISDIVDEMTMQFDESRSLLNIETGEIVFIQDEFLRRAEDDESIDDEEQGWMQEAMELAYDIIESVDKYHELPSTYEINEYRIMEAFCFTVKNEGKKNQLLRAIQGKGAFRRFKDTAFELGLIEDWYRYRDERFKEIAIEYCKDLGIEYIE